MGMQSANDIAEGDQLKLMGRDYLAEQSEWNGAVISEGEMRTFSLNGSSSADSFSNIDDKTLQLNVFPNTDQVLVNIGDKTIMAWVTDNPDRSAINRTQIVYSVLENGSWSEPKTMDADNTADFRPVMSSIDGGALIAWELQSDSDLFRELATTNTTRRHP